MILKSFPIHKKNIIYFISVFFLSISIGAEPNLLFSINFNDDPISSTVNLIRIISPICLIILNLFLIVKSKKKFKSDKFLIIFFLYIISTIIGYFLNLDKYVEFTLSDFWRNNYLVLQSLSFLLVLTTLLNFDIDFKNIIFFILSIVFTIYGYFILVASYNFFLNLDITLYTSDYLTNGNLFGQAVPRSSGISRIVALLIILLTLINFFKKNGIIKIIILSIFISALLLIMLNLQSRTVIYAIFFILFLILLTSFRNNFFHSSYKLMSLILIFFIFYNYIPKIIFSINAHYVVNNYLKNCEIKFNSLVLNTIDKQKIINNVLLGKNDCENFQKIKKFKLKNLKDNLLLERNISLDRNFTLPNDISDVSFDVYEDDYFINLAKNISKTHEFLEILKIEDFFLIENLIFNKKTLSEFLKNKKKNLNYKNKKQIYKLYDLIDSRIMFYDLNNCKYRNTKIDNIFTGRICHSHIAINKTGFQFFGKGATFDRQILKWGLSNSLIYTYVSGGIIGIFFYIFIILRVCKYSIEYFLNIIIKKKIINEKRIIFHFFFFTIIFFIIRSITEISFSYWGIDQLLFLLILIYYEKFLYKKSSQY